VSGDFAVVGFTEVRELPRRLPQLVVGLLCLGAGIAATVRADLGLSPYDVLHQGLARRIGLSVGTWVILVGAAVLALWIPLRQRPGFGTLSNVIVIGVVVDAFLALVDQPHALGGQIALLSGGVLLNGVATGCYIGAGLGPGPRDGLMVGLAARGHSIRLVRTGIEVTVLVAGWLLGGTVGVGTVAYALCIGPLAHVFVPALAIDGQSRRGAISRLSAAVR
jgi:uncharacterized membrane protein YczE